MKNNLKIILFILLPKNLLSKLIGMLSDIKVPKFILKWYIGRFSVKNNINLDEAELQLDEFMTFNQFFTRKLKKLVRVIDSDEKAIVSPVDSTIVTYGEIDKHTLLQIKGKPYSLFELVRDKELANTFVNGTYITFYLRPIDCHRIHTPIDGTVFHFEYVPGKLFTVNEFGRASFKNLFCVNERLTTFLDTQVGKVAVVSVGATNVGRIKMHYLSENRINRSAKHAVTDNVDNYTVSKGEELGYFELGSTIIVLFEKGKVVLSDCREGKHVQYGTRVATIR